MVANNPIIYYINKTGVHTIVTKNCQEIPDISHLREIARQVRLDIIEMLFKAGSGHTGGSLSATDILVALFFAQMRLNPQDPCWPQRDRFVLSKGHAAPALYAVLSRLGYFPREELFTLRQFGSSLQGHPDSSCTPGVEVSTGSLGQGLSIANGMALASRLNGGGTRVYALLGDGEVQEGQIWEAAMTAAHYRLDNLVAVLDRNRLQIDGRTAEVMSLEPLAQKWEAFGWHTLEVDGHAFPELLAGLQETHGVKGRPSMIIAHTVKGKGVSIFENQVKYHGVTPSKEEYEQALKELHAA
ncbi:MAG: transketolase [Deltaproteobacteria bacterium]|nr:transketolase [Deltaproteobacteria bacterium]MBI4796264.1 transketolase [Deltaproteobacteria bacterium]